MIRSTWTGLVPADFGTYTVFDPAPAWDHGLPTDGFDRATVNGFIGQGAPWAALIICGTRYGPVRLTVEVHDSPVDVEGEWTEIVECQFVPARRTSKGAEIEAALDVLAPRTVVMLSPQGLNHRPRPSTRLRRGAHNNEHGIQDQVPLTAGVVTRALRRASSRAALGAAPGDLSSLRPVEDFHRLPWRGRHAVQRADGREFPHTNPPRAVSN